MRKKEYIHTHALLREVARDLIETETMSVETLSAYDALGTGPSCIHKSKEHHHEAILTLTSAIEPCLTEKSRERHEQSMTRQR
ncbi:UPF0058 family protein [Halorarius litoreus]|uniref:UPF0058 family protein n=1 Tax=Halorarius litoreus TaxID=2962676 RepID=UPI0020CD414B|nr:UPF0058 family protein [Halorarius litoreus]